MITRQAVHKLIDDLPDERLDEAGEILQQLGDSEGADDFRAYLDSLPLEDEPLSEREQAAVERWRRGERRGVALTPEEMERLVLGVPVD